mmetsp:Transcript_23380/g.70042  ORF Transcript_23380/g.70042 Transcript_23380/m.70042 type:complete len:288 (-) Transcript_23380:16-879(-)
MQAEHEQFLRDTAGKGHEMVQQMVRSLSGALIYPEAGNVSTNEKLWDVYAGEWGAEREWVTGMAAGNRDAREPLDAVGDEWAPRAHTRRVIDEWLLPLCGPRKACAEIGSGGGRVAALVAPKVAALHCFDVSGKMLKAAEARLRGVDNVAFTLIHGDAEPADAGFGAGPRAYPAAAERAFDVVYCFDVMVHMDAHAMYRCLKRIASLLKDGEARAFVSTANLLAPDGWGRFEKQAKYSVGGFYFVTPETVRALAARAGLAVERELLRPDASNTYYNRDYLAVLKLQE